ncbi:hypothetical protein NLB33_27095 [Mycolicibacterium smegmatis]|uniref:hypothetical protein n=1 Tax=Mycolicibacterium smegmatis TaxID=1772 RepID=UPI0020A3F5E8|nr:hypothetical protein [Mycolicibacterium smegmatis]MCP2626515.1 hypothetical protein [Mycolicibacterium smegmatis]
MTIQGADETRQKWLQQVREHPEATERHILAAEVMAHSEHVPEEHVEASDDLARWGFAIKNPGGTYAAVIPFR